MNITELAHFGLDTNPFELIGTSKAPSMLNLT